MSRVVPSKDSGVDADIEAAGLSQHLQHTPPSASRSLAKPGDETLPAPAAATKSPGGGFRSAGVLETFNGSTPGTARRRQFEHRASAVHRSDMAIRKAESGAGARVLMPTDPRVLRLDLIVFVALVYTASITPFELAFIDATDDTSSGLFWCNRICDLAFVADLVCNFFRAFRGGADDGGRMVKNRRRIAQRYLRGWFWIDALATVPWDLLAMLVAEVDKKTMNKTKTLRLLRTLRILKFARMFRAGRMLRRWEKRVTLKYAEQALIKFMFIVIFVSHWIACAWRLVLRYESREVTDWYYEGGYDKKYDLTDWRQLYVITLYWAVTTISTIGYGDAANPSNSTERVWAIVCMLVGSILWAYVIGAICTLISALDQDTAVFHQTMDQLTVLMRRAAVPTELKTRLREFFHEARRATVARAHNSLLLQMSPMLRGSVAMHMHAQWIERVPWIKGSSEAFMSSLSLELVVSMYAPRELIEGTELHIVMRGVVAMGRHVICSGGVWGSDTILTSRRLQRTAPARAMTYVECSSLPSVSLWELLEKFPAEYKKMRTSACWLALRRWMLWYVTEMRLLCAEMKEKIEGGLNVRDLFLKHDQDGNGTLSVQEFSQCLDDCGIEYDEDVLLMLMWRFDSDHTGDVSYEEFQEFVGVFDSRSAAERTGNRSSSLVTNMGNAKAEDVVAKNLGTRDMRMTEDLRGLTSMLKSLKEGQQKRDEKEEQERAQMAAQAQMMQTPGGTIRRLSPTSSLLGSPQANAYVGGGAFGGRMDAAAEERVVKQVLDGLDGRLQKLVDAKLDAQHTELMQALGQLNGGGGTTVL